jgi:hypothetical protein
MSPKQNTPGDRDKNPRVNPKDLLSVAQISESSSTFDFEWTSYMPSSCKEIRAELAKCMQQSECVLINRHTVAECLKDKELFETQVPDECHRLRKSFYNCRRGLV